MGMNEQQRSLIQLIRQEGRLDCSPDWSQLHTIALQQGLLSTMVDGISIIPENQRPKKDLLLPWIGSTINEEKQYDIQWKAACELAELLKGKGIRTYVLKGAVVSECYPVPQHRRSVDLDCYLLSDTPDRDVWEGGNSIIEDAGYIVKRDYYKNSTWIVPGLTVENHRWLTPFRGNKRLTALERLLQGMLNDDIGGSRFEGTWLYRPPVMASVIFLIEHAYSHFLHEGLIWRHVLDWMMFMRKHKDEIDWQQLNAWIDEFGFRKFYDSYIKLGQLLMGECEESDLSEQDAMMLADIWSPLDLHETVKGFRGKMALAGNTWRARWKYREFTDITWIKALWIQVKGFIFIKEPKLYYGGSKSNGKHLV